MQQCAANAHIIFWTMHFLGLVCISRMTYILTFHKWWKHPRWHGAIKDNVHSVRNVACLVSCNQSESLDQCEIRVRYVCVGTISHRYIYPLRQTHRHLPSFVRYNFGIHMPSTWFLPSPFSLYPSLMDLRMVDSLRKSYQYVNVSQRDHDNMPTYSEKCSLVSPQQTHNPSSLRGGLGSLGVLVTTRTPIADNLYEGDQDYRICVN